MLVRSSTMGKRRAGCSPADQSPTSLARIRDNASRVIPDNLIMANRRLTEHELETLARPLIDEVRARLVSLADGDAALMWALRRKLYKELTYDERSKPMQRRQLKFDKWKEQRGLCATCNSELPDKYAVLDRLVAMDGYTKDNTRLLCPQCDTAEQVRRGYA